MHESTRQDESSHYHNDRRASTGARHSCRFNVGKYRMLEFVESLIIICQSSGINAALLSRHGTVKTNLPHAAKESWLARTHPRQARMGLETIHCRIEEGFSRLASTRLFAALRRSGRDTVRHVSTPRSFPVPRRAEWEAILREPDDSAKRKKLEAWLDRGHGECWLRRGEAGGTR